MPLPVPDAFDEGFATYIAAVLALTAKLALHHQLGGDAGVIGARKPQRGSRACDASAR